MIRNNDLMIPILVGLLVNTKMPNRPLGFKLVSNLPCNKGNTPDKGRKTTANV